MSDPVNNLNVLFTLQDDQGVVRVVLTQRCSNMRSHGGEVCLPGGKRDPADGGDDVVTALREAQEEVSGQEGSR